MKFSWAGEKLKYETTQKATVVFAFYPKKY